MYSVVYIFLHAPLRCLLDFIYVHSIPGGKNYCSYSTFMKTKIQTVKHGQRPSVHVGPLPQGVFQ